MFCSNCGKEIDENVKFCSNCGAENVLLSSEKENKDELKEKKVKNKKEKKKVIKIVSLIIGIFLIILCACKIIESSFIFDNAIVNSHSFKVNSAKDRDSINVNDSFRGNFYEIQYGKNKFKGNFELGLEKVEKTTFYNESANNQWEKYTSNNILISKGGKSQFRASAEIETEVKNLNDKFYITFNLPNSEGKTTPFTYVVNDKK